jgi:GDP-4-dehydro-6-deoxy-D-mannose reductase
MRPKRILVTGAEGFVGGHLLPTLAAGFPQATLLGRGETRLDVVDRAAVFAGIAAQQPDICIHLAAISAVGAAASDPARAWAVNLHGAINIAEAIMRHAPDCRMLFVSSAEVYGGSFRTGAALDEAAPLNPMNLYAATKAAAEMALAALAARGLLLVRLRPFNHAGPGQSDTFVLPAFASQIARIEAGLQAAVIQVGALTPERDFLDVRDVCSAYAACIARIEDIPANGIINIASGSAVTIGALLEMLLRRARCPIAVEEDPARLRPVEIPRALGCADYAKNVLGWQPRYTLDQTVESVLDDARNVVARN